jgi:RHS repeat-associated protein
MVYDAFGQLMEYNNGRAETQDFMWLQGRPFATYVAGTRFLHANPLGSTLALTDHYGNYTQDAVYDAWGNVWASTGTVEDTRFASLGKRDAETDLDPALARLHSSSQMRWLSPDPLAGDILNPQSLNRYAYVLNNPTTLTDPTGLCFYSQATGGCLDPQQGYRGAPPTTYLNWLNARGGWDFVGMMSLDTVAGYTPGDFLGLRGDDPGYWVFTAEPVLQSTILSLQASGSVAASTPSEADKAAAQRAATQHCQDNGQISFNIPLTKIPVTVSLSTTIAYPNYSSTNDWSIVVPTVPPAPSFGGSIDVTFNAPTQPSFSVNVGAGKNLSVATFFTPKGPQGLTFGVGPSIGPPVTISVPMGTTCGQITPEK